MQLLISLSTDDFQPINSHVSCLEERLDGRNIPSAEQGENREKTEILVVGAKARDSWSASTWRLKTCDQIKYLKVILDGDHISSITKVAFFQLSVSETKRSDNIIHVL